jgi:hypothetical protein
MASETLSQKQQRFSWLVAKMIIYANEAGYGITLGECYRTKEQAAIYAKEGKGIANSVHCDRLAIDINLFRDGKYLTDISHYKILGDWWVIQYADCKWGGNFMIMIKRKLIPNPDPCHFSFEYAGRA